MSTSHDTMGLERNPNFDYVELSQLDKIIKLRTKRGQQPKYRLPNKRVVRMDNDPLIDPAEFRFEMYCLLNHLEYESLTPISELAESDLEMYTYSRGTAPKSLGKRGDEYFSNRFDKKSRASKRGKISETGWSEDSGLEKIGGGLWDSQMNHHRAYFKRSLVDGTSVEEELFVPRFSGNSEENEQLRLIEFDCWLAGEVFRRNPTPQIQEEEASEIEIGPETNPDDSSSEARSVEGSDHDLIDEDGPNCKLAGGGSPSPSSPSDVEDSSVEEGEEEDFPSPLHSSEDEENPPRRTKGKSVRCRTCGGTGCGEEYCTMVTTDPLRRGLPTPKAQPSPIVTDEDERRMARIQIFYLNRQVKAYDNLAPTNPSAMRTRLRMRQQAIEQIMSLETILQHDRAESHRERSERHTLPPSSARTVTSTAGRTAATPAGQTRASPSTRTTATDRTALSRARRASPPPGDPWSFPATAAKPRRAPSPPPILIG